MQIFYSIPVQVKPNSLGGKKGFGSNDRTAQDSKTILGPSSGIITQFIYIYTQLLGCIYHHVRTDVHTLYCKVYNGNVYMLQYSFSSP